MRFLLVFVLTGVLISFCSVGCCQVSQTEFHTVYPRQPEKIIIVGGNSSDIQGFNSKSIQWAIDILTAYGRGGIIKLNPGTYMVDAPIEITSGITLEGSGQNTILKKSGGIKTSLVGDAYYGELKLDVKSISGFQPGMAVQVYCDNKNTCWWISKAIVTSITDNTLYIDEELTHDYSATRNGTVSNACSVISAAQKAQDITIRNLAVEGNAGENDYINGCVGGGIYLRSVKNVTIENVVINNFNGDGISWQITEDITVRNNEIMNCTNYGLHPGTGSVNTTIINNNCHDNGEVGLFICWRVQNGIIKNNWFHHNGNYGISTGYKDNDLLFYGNKVTDNGLAGVYFRREKPDNAPQRNTFENNVIENNGTKGMGYGFLIDSPIQDVVLKNNIIRSTKVNMQIAGIFISKNGSAPQLDNNTFEGHIKSEIEKKKQ